MFSVTVRTVRRWDELGLLKAELRTLGRQRRYNRREVEDLLTAKDRAVTRKDAH